MKRAHEIPQYNFNRWVEEMGKMIGEKLVVSKRVVVCIAGASASGKSEAAEHLRRELEGQGKRAGLLSTDDYYKGISLIMSEKKIEADEVDFDVPESVDFERLERDLAALKRGEKITAPKYSMYLSEPSGEREIDGSQAEVILLEGIWALNERLAEYADLAVFVEADYKTLFIRRFRRDVLGGRSSHTPEFTLKIILEKVLTAYQKHILPTRAWADMILTNNYTGLETFDVGQYDVQDKIPLSEAEAEDLRSRWGEARAVFFQEDYYFSNELVETNVGYDPEHLLRVRVENGRLKSLTHKGSKLKRADGKIIRPSEYFIKKGEFGVYYKDIDGLIESFKNGGFKLEARFSKIREMFQSGGVAVALDNIEGLGIFVELSANNKLSKAPEIDEFKRRFGLENRRPAGPYIDEYFKKLSFEPSAAKKSEDLLNAGASRELMLKDGLCSVLDNDEKVQEAVNIIRRGYPDLPENQQCFGREFRSAANIVINAVAVATIRKKPFIEALNWEKHTNPEKLDFVVLLPWRSGLVFGKSYRALGARRFYHLSSKRNEETLETEVDYEGGDAKESDTVIIADPMLATGNTVVDAISRIRNKGVLEENIILNAVIAAPAGVARIKKDYPLVKIIVGALDEKLDHRGFIVPGLGDFGDKYFAEMSGAELRNLADSFGLDEPGRQKMIRRISKQAVSETLAALLERDFKDMEIDRENRARLASEGLAAHQPKKIIKIDTSRVGGVESVVNIIISEIGADEKIIAIEGQSGVGKTSATEHLAEKLGAAKLSFGEVFRYLTYLTLKEDHFDAESFSVSVKRFSYSASDGALALMDGPTNISIALADELHSVEVERRLPDIAGRTQALVIGFLEKNLEFLRVDSGQKILIEGRAFSLDFLPCDLRVKLVADPSIRADRRWAQQAS